MSPFVTDKLILRPSQAAIPSLNAPCKDFEQAAMDFACHLIVAQDLAIHIPARLPADRLHMHRRRINHLDVRECIRLHT